METRIVPMEKPRLRNAVLIEGLPGVGNVGRVAAGYLVSQLKMKKLAELYSPHFLPLVILHPDGTTSALKNEFYYLRGKDKDVVVLTGDTQSITPEGHYDICEKIIIYANQIGVKTIITIGGFAEGRDIEEPRVIGAVNDKSLVKKYEKFGIDFGKGHPVGTIVGASGLLIGIGKQYGIEGIALLGQTSGFPIVTDPKAADRVLAILSKILDLKIDLSKLENIIEEMESRIRHAVDLQKQMLEQIRKPKDDMRYIG